MSDKVHGPYESHSIYRPHDEEPPRPRYEPVTEAGVTPGVTLARFYGRGHDTAERRS